MHATIPARGWHDTDCHFRSDSMNQYAQEVAALLQKRLDDLAGLLTSTPDRDSQLIVALFDRWLDSTTTFLVEYFGRYEAQRFLEVCDSGLIPRLTCAKRYAHFLIALKLEVQRHPELVLPRTALAPTVTREGIFFAGQQFDAFMKVQTIISSATASVYVIDNYISPDFIDMFTRVGQGISVQILTRSPDGATKQSAHKFNQQHGGLKIRLTQEFHDRFLIIDRRDYYHFGASIKDLGTKGFMFSRIEESTITRALQQ